MSLHIRVDHNHKSKSAAEAEAAEADKPLSLKNFGYAKVGTMDASSRRRCLIEACQFALAVEPVMAMLEFCERVNRYRNAQSAEIFLADRQWLARNAAAIGRHIGE